MKLSFKKTLLAVLTFGGGTALLFVLTFIHINQGSVSIPASLVVEAVVNPQDTIAHHTVRVLRMPRAVRELWQEEHLLWREWCCRPLRRIH